MKNIKLKSISIFLLHLYTNTKIIITNLKYIFNTFFLQQKQSQNMYKVSHLNNSIKNKNLLTLYIKVVVKNLESKILNPSFLHTQSK